MGVMRRAGGKAGTVARGDRENEREGEARGTKTAHKGESDVHDEVDVRLGHAEEERELEHRGQRARAPGLDRQADKAAHHELAALERLALLLHVVQLSQGYRQRLRVGGGAWPRRRAQHAGVDGDGGGTHQVHHGSHDRLWC